MTTGLMKIAHPRSYAFLRRPECDAPFADVLKRIGVDGFGASWRVWEAPTGFLFGWPLTCEPSVTRTNANGRGFEPATLDGVTLPARMVTERAVR